MRSLENIGLLTIAFVCGWLIWKYLEPRYVAAKEQGGPEWVRIERITVWSVIGGAIVGAMLIGMLFVWLDG